MKLIINILEILRLQQKTEQQTYNEWLIICMNTVMKIMLHLYLTVGKEKQTSEITIYECEDCTNCQYKSKCTKSQYNKQLRVSKKFIEKRKKSFENITSEQGILYRMNWLIQVEGAVEVIKKDYEFQRFLLKGKSKVKLEILLLCIGYNINKLHSKIQNNRTKKPSF